TEAEEPWASTTDTRSRRTYASRSRATHDPVTASSRRRAAIEPEVSTRNTTRFPSRPCRTPHRRSSRCTPAPLVPAPSRRTIDARAVSRRCSRAPPTVAGLATSLPDEVTAPDRLPTAPRPVPSSRSTADGPDAREESGVAEPRG